MINSLKFKSKCQLILMYKKYQIKKKSQLIHIKMITLANLLNQFKNNKKWQNSKVIQ